jgi:hypothetical protein
VLENISGPALTGLRATVRLPILNNDSGPVEMRATG